MKIIKTKWFRRRKYSGWGLTPVTWQGWVFIAVLIAPLIFLASKIELGINLLSPLFISFAIYFAIFLGVIFAIMAKIHTDERERVHEAISDRNALWFLIFVLALGIVAESFSPDLVRTLYPINPFVFGGIIGAWIVKVISAIYLDKID